MKKIVSLFQRNYDGDRLVRDEIVPGAEWVVDGEGRATVKRDGTCCLWKDGQLWKRYDVKKGRSVPEGFVPAQDPDAVTGHWPGWVPVGLGKEDRWHREGLANYVADCGGFDGLREGQTYELCGPKINGGNEGLPEHLLIEHGDEELEDFPRTFDAIREALAARRPMIEGVVWHHPDGRMVKIKAKDFGIERAGQ